MWNDCNNSCEMRSKKWIFPGAMRCNGNWLFQCQFIKDRNDFFLSFFHYLLKEEWVRTPALPAHCYNRFLYYNAQSLLVVIVDLAEVVFFWLIISVFCSCFLRGMGKFPSASVVYCLHSSCGHNTPSLLDMNLSFDFGFLPSSLARLFFLFLFGVQGERTLLQAMYRSIQIWNL